MKTSECRGIFEPLGYYTARSHDYHPGSFYFFKEITPTRIPVIGGKVHLKSDYSVSPSNRAPGYWDHDHLITDNSNQAVTRSSIGAAQAYCRDNADCAGFFAPQASYSVRGVSYYPGSYYFFTRITPTRVSVTGGKVHSKKLIHRDDVMSLSAFNHYRNTSFEQRPSLEGASWSKGISKLVADIAKNKLWADYKSHIVSTRATEMTQVTRQINEHDVFEMTIDNKTMPFAYYQFGSEPEGGYSLLINLHGGGTGSHQLNEQNWAGFIPYRPNAIPNGLITVSPRSLAPAWNMWWQPDVDGFLDRIVTNMIAFRNVNPNKVYLTGYSAGGDGVYHLGPRMADRWAGAMMSAGHPNGAKMESLYNTCYGIAMGKQDSAHNRYNVAVQYADRLGQLQNQYGGYRYTTGFYDTGHGMGGRESSQLNWVMQCNRIDTPAKVVWNVRQNDRFYWLKTQNTSRGLFEVVRSGNTFNVEQAPNSMHFILRFNDRMIKFGNAVKVKNQLGQVEGTCTPSRKISVILNTIIERGDPKQVYSDECTIQM